MRGAGTTWWTRSLPEKRPRSTSASGTAGGGLVARFICVLLWHSRLLGVFAQDHRSNAEEACRAGR